VEHVELNAAGLSLRPWRDEDAAAVLDAVRDPQTALWNGQSGVVDLATAREWVRWRADWTGGQRSFAVADPADGALLGAVSVHRIQHDDASLGYWTVPAARGRGVAVAAVRLVAGWAFGALELHRLEICHAVGNVASCKVAERAGFPWEGTLRESHRYGDGRRHDEHLHARLATDV
jgi:RimJ/RimL family protein N-acetyltransferase